MSKKNLLGLHVIITRPLLQSENLKEGIIAHNGKPILFPTLQIVAVPNEKSYQQFKNFGEMDLLIFTSRNAVDFAAPFLPFDLTIKVAAIGPTTGLALKRHHISVDVQPSEKFSSESLLEDAFFDDVASKNIAIISGEGGRSWLEETLKAKGAYVKKIPVYRRIRPDVEIHEVESLTSLNNCIFVSTSCESLENLIDIMHEYSKEAWLNRTPILIISERMKQFALSKGLKEAYLLLSKNATDQAILESLIKWYANQPA